MEQIERIYTSIILVVRWPEDGESHSMGYLFYQHVITRYITRKASSFI